MKTIKKLEKEIKKLEKRRLEGYAQHSDRRRNKYARIREEAKIETRKEVCKEIDKQIKNYQKLNKMFPKNQTFVDMWTALFALQQRLEGEE